VKIFILASGSEGNAAVFESNGTSILVDGGVRPQALVQKLSDLGTSLVPQAVVVTHAHQDHVGHAARLSKKLKIPVYASEATARAAFLGDPARVRRFVAREPFVIGNITLTPTPVPHDAAQVALTLSDGSRTAAIATDLGQVTGLLSSELARCDVVLVESNYDPGMLALGPYPEFLKRRVDSARGHLSNLQTHELLRWLPPRVSTVVLLHLSRTNNRPDIALDVARDALSGRRVQLLAASPSEPLVIEATGPKDERVHRVAERPLSLRRRSVDPRQLSLF
jgi:phosphoribosyl 1,2-cyclic phosphodiesterase